MRSIRKLLLLLAVAALHASVASAEETYRWIQYVDGGLEARAITSAASCPKATRDGTAETMTVRAERNDDFPILVCTLSFPKGTNNVVIGEVPLALPKPAPARILLIGDTGCRIKGAAVQACNDIAAWPFRLIADIAAEMKPDLVIHVGDYYYRENKCPDNKLGCAGSPSGDGWDSWREDFFAPAGPLLAAAPWVFVRGNHEACGRGGKGWSRLLNAFPFNAVSACKDNYESSLSNVSCEKDVSPRFVVDVGDIKLVVIDVAAADEKYDVPNGLVECYRPQFEAAKSLGAGPVWLAFHEPIWSPVGVKGGEISVGNKTLASAARGVIPPNVQAMLSGHIHTFEVMSYMGDLPIQIVSGNGGDRLEENPLVQFDRRQIDDVKVKIGRGVPHSFGFAMLERNDGEWSVVSYDKHARKLMTCRMHGRTINCD
ncbi:MAG: metallophosphoesterase family protein [Xanthobacteraceae bacterium]